MRRASVRDGEGGFSTTGTSPPPAVMPVSQWQVLCCLGSAGECRHVLRFSCNHTESLASSHTPATLPCLQAPRLLLSCDTFIRGGPGAGAFPVRGGRLLCSRAPVWCRQGLV